MIRCMNSSTGNYSKHVALSLGYTKAVSVLHSREELLGCIKEFGNNYDMYVSWCAQYVNDEYYLQAVSHDVYSTVLVSTLTNIH